MTRMNRTLAVIGMASLVAAVVVLTAAAVGRGDRTEEDTPSDLSEAMVVPASVEDEPPHPMAVDVLRNRPYPGGEFVLEEELSDGSGYSRSVVSYRSEGLKIRGLLTVPRDPAPDGGFPAVVFVHGYIPPAEYSTVRNYATYQDRLARAGYVTFKPDLRGHGLSEGTPVSAHYSEKYVVDTMFAIAYLKNHEDVDPNRIGYWGHSNGGEIGLRVAVISPDIKAASLWAGVVGSYEDMFETYNDQIRFLRNAGNSSLVRAHGLPSTNPEFWRTVDPYFHLDDIRAPIQILHGTADYSVPVVLSRRLREELERADRRVDYFEYVGDDHNISANVDDAFRRTVEFYRSYL